MKERSSVLIDIAAIAIVAVWGLTFISTKVLLGEGLKPTEIFVLRFVIAYLGIWVLCLGRKQTRLFAGSLKDELLMAGAGITGGSVYFLAENTALAYTQASNVSFLVCTTPLVTAVLAILLGRIRAKSDSPHWSAPLAIGSVIAIAGIALIAFNGEVVLKFSPLGDALALCASLVWALYSLLVDDLATRWDPLIITRKVFFYGLLTILPVFALHPWSFSLAAILEPRVLLNILFLGVVASLVCYAAWTPIIRRLGTIKASNYIYLNPLFTLAGAVLILGERVTLLSGLGSALVLAGVWIASRKKIKIFH